MGHTALHVKRTRRVFVAGRLRPRREHKPCENGWHAGPMVDVERFSTAGWVWRDCGNCAACGSTIHRSQLRRIA